ncbi:hypothetical protein ASPFODRAFT_60226 [Aspergillus luchuensis CBS 106.47]|uniref:Uncharacterized protein n=1 Tax=Aspergillus luchuensis (strain CBS 106.47) TaxID=1137211 RepID=A0A1M3TM61_ASPLC|nr:hypothetical protein ASPFODRAFT_60226 [Aspergillus luchuensis CBS 106.47]
MRQKGRHKLIRSPHRAHVPDRLAVPSMSLDSLTKRFSEHPNFLHCDRLSRISSDGSIAPPLPVSSNESATRRQIGSLLCTRPITLQRAPVPCRDDGAISSDKLCPLLQVTDSIKRLPHPPVERLPAADCRRCW